LFRFGVKLIKSQQANTDTVHVIAI